MSDDPLEQVLRDALNAEVPPRRGPSADAIARLRAAADEQRATASGPAADAARPTAARAPWRRRLLVAAAVVVAFVGGALLTADPPGAVREVAHRVGLDVETSDLVAARDRLQVLGSALDAATRRQVEGRLTDAELDAVARADRDMLQAVAELDEGDRAEFVPTAHQVHLRAVALFVAEGRDLATAQPRDLEEIGAGS